MCCYLAMMFSPTISEQKASNLKWSYDGTWLLWSSVVVCPIGFHSLCYASEISQCFGWLVILQQPVYCLSAKADSLWEGL